MSPAKDGSTPPLPQELQRALHDAVGNSLGAFDVLRSMLRRHVRSERDRGVSLENIDRDLRTLITRAEKKAAGAGHPDGDGKDGDGADGDGDLTAQVIRWSGVFFRSPRTEDGSE